MGEDFFLAFSPERVDPGNPNYGTRNTPKVVGGITPDCRRVAVALYQPAIDTLVPVSTTEAAELVKLLENTFRSVNIGLVNEMAIVCDKLGVDVWEVIEAAATKPFGFMKFMPGPGLGGHCIPLDPHYLAWKMRGLNYKTRFIDLAGEINTEMPLFWVRKVAEALNDQGKAVRGASVLVLGVAYKRDIDDMRESPALDIIRLLEEQGADVTLLTIRTCRFREDGHEFRSVPLDAETVAAADCVMIVTDHTAVDYQHDQASRASWWSTRATRCRKRTDMHVAVIGTGYVGLVAGACLAETGNDVVCVDVDAAKIERLAAERDPDLRAGARADGEAEPGGRPAPLHHRPRRGGARARASSSSPWARRRARTARPTCSTCSAWPRTIGRHMNGHKVVVTKSTVPVGTAEKVRAAVAARDRASRSHVCSNPEFLKEGAAIDDFMKPDRVVLGVDDEEAQAVMGELYAPFVRRAAIRSSSWTSPPPRSPSTPPTPCSPRASRS